MKLRDRVELAVRFGQFWDGVERVSGSAATIALIFTIGYLAATLILRGWR